MRQYATCIFLLAFATNVVQAQAAPENLLPAKSQIYFRFDGRKAHVEAFNQTAWGQTLQGDTGEFLKELWKYTKEQAMAVIADKEPAYEALAKDAFSFAESLCQNGIVLGVEVGPGAPVTAQLVMVFPKGASDTGTLLPLLQKISEKAGANLQDQKVGNRIVHLVDLNMVRFGWWREGEDALVYIGTDDPVEYAKGLAKPGDGVSRHPLLKQVSEFKEFKTNTRAFVDLQAIFGMVAGFSPEAEKVVDELGFKGLKNVTYVAGFGGAHMRSVMEWEISGPRKGLLSLSSDQKLNLATLPPLPAELTSLGATSSKMSKMYEVMLDVGKNVTKIFAPDQVENITEGIKAVEALVGVNFNDDIFACLGDVAVTYSGRNDGLLSNVTLFQVKNEKKLAKSLETLLKAVPPLPGFELVVKKTPYHGAELVEIAGKTDQATTSMFSYSVHKGWFIYSAYPQGAKGFILRDAGKLPRWKADGEISKILSEMPKEFTGVGIFDPRPTMQTVIGVLPLLATIGNAALSQAMPQLQAFPVGSIPHPEEATMRLQPTVTITIDRGTKIRMESRGSIPGPF